MTMRAPASVRLTLDGFVPSKKNLYRRGRGGRMYLDDDVSAQIDWLVTQAARQWQRREPLEHPAMRFEFHVTNRRSDRDNKVTCLMDVLQKAGVLVNDNVAKCNGQITILPAVVGDAEKTVIELEAGL